jgi:hypothetical protein
MRLIDLEPSWLESEGRKVAIIFLCPHCVGTGRRQWLTCFFVATGSLPRDADGFRGDRKLFKEFLKAKGEGDPEFGAWSVVSCRPEMAWNRTSDSFEDMTITPSIDASDSGHWHGSISNGNVQ